MKSSFFKAVAVLVSLACSAAVCSAATVTWGARTDQGVAQQDGTPVPVGSLLMLGNFGSLTPTQIHSASLATLQANFIQFNTVTRHVGDGSPLSSSPTPTSADAGTWLDTDTNSTLTLGIANKAVYYWVFNGTTIGNSSQMGIFTAFYTGASATIKANWTFPSDNAIPPTVTDDLDQVIPYTDGTRTGTVIDINAIVFGAYGTGTVGGSPAYNLAPVPEPSSLCLLGVFGFGLAVLYQRRRVMKS